MLNLWESLCKGFASDKLSSALRVAAPSFRPVQDSLEAVVDDDLFSPLIGLEKILSSAIIQIRGMFHDKKGLHSRIQRTDIKGIPGGWECFACR